MINARSSGSLHRQVRRMLILCIAVVVLLSTSVGLGIGLYQEVRTRDQLLSNAAQMAADAPLLTEDIRADNAQQYLARTVQRVSEIDKWSRPSRHRRRTSSCLRCCQTNHTGTRTYRLRRWSWKQDDSSRHRCIWSCSCCRRSPPSGCLQGRIRTRLHG